MKYLNRSIETTISETLIDTPVIIINGPRQAGKTTLLKQILPTHGTYITLDDENMLVQAQSDPIGLLHSLDHPIAIDEIQRAPELIKTIKLLVDENRQPGSFILTGSANLMTIPKLSDSLAGRAEFIELYPFSQSELAQTKNSFLTQLFNNKFLPLSQKDNKKDLTTRIISGGYPEALSRTALRRTRWHRSYLNAIVQRDIKDIFNIQKISELTLLLDLVAIISTQQLVINYLAKNAKLDNKSVEKYIYALEGLYIVKRIPAWHKNELKRTTKQPKLHFIDSGLLCSMRNLTTSLLLKNSTLFGTILENFVATELLKIISFTQNNYRLFHYRDKDKREVDFIITNPDNIAVGIEIKASMTVRKNMFRSIDHLLKKGVLSHGIVLYTGNQVVRLDSQKIAVPINALWS